MFQRKPKYYNWVVKLYIPFLFLGVLYVFGQFALIRTAKQVIDKERQGLTIAVYTRTLGFYFENEESKDEFVHTIQEAAIAVEEGQSDLAKELESKAKTYNTGIAIVDRSKDRLSSYLAEKYKSDIYKVALYGMLSAAGRHVNVMEDVPYGEFSKGVDFLASIGHKDLEVSVKSKLDEWLESVLSSVYKNMMWTTFYLFLLVICIPLVEFFIYIKWIEKKLSVNG